jgi:hypothetical protein
MMVLIPSNQLLEELIIFQLELTMIRSTYRVCRDSMMLHLNPYRNTRRLISYITPTNLIVDG